MASEPPTGHDLHHHGDLDAEPGLIDFAVNVQGDGPPAWLRDRLVLAIDELGRYPGAVLEDRARATVGERHGRPPEQVLPLAGAAEGFALLPALGPRHAVVVHPGFTEPEAALREAGVAVTRVLTDPAHGHRLDPSAVPADADLVVIGNPTNPTGVLHPAASLRELARPGRVLVVDEAFADAVPGEPESLAGDPTVPGLLVLRSLTKTWALAGLRAGYALGDPVLLERLAAPRPHWPVSSLALEAIVACCEPDAVSAGDQRAREMAGNRVSQSAALSAIEGVEVQQGVAPYLLLHLPDGTGELVRARLRERGIAVRRADTFPGLGADHVRVAVRPPETARVLAAALDDALCSLVGASGELASRH
ncbi:Rv2231c family pyridoxal phosphate-dependent protein CobC [Pseudonocardia endophytica]|uniref:Aminotransferase n=1 Tax=Pseudonocardia endophytica TaxID=401976 RepID=A0A4R1HU62_PSEEN|nr:Rv2231c family pyridoxal phosphate-dependent protein CobC [Pseudonocardia endophytica]TCK24893.1 histidinol-phosphate aminotransferase [Pseudonocardia endophytica]